MQSPAKSLSKDLGGENSVNNQMALSERCKFLFKTFVLA